MAVEQAQANRVQELMFAVGKGFDVQRLLNAVFDQFTFFEACDSLV